MQILTSTLWEKTETEEQRSNLWKLSKGLSLLEEITDQRLEAKIWEKCILRKSVALRWEQGWMSLRNS